MSKDNKNNQSNKDNFNQHGFSDDSEDFLDSLMEDVMGTSEETQESMLAEPAPDSRDTNKRDNTHDGIDSNIGNNEYTQVDNEETHVDIDDNREPSKPRRRGGLLNRFSGNASNESLDTSDKVESGTKDKTTTNEDKEVLDTEVKVNKAPLNKANKDPLNNNRRRVPLLSRVTSTNNDESDIETQDNNSSEGRTTDKLTPKNESENKQDLESTGKKWVPNFKANHNKFEDSHEAGSNETLKSNDTEVHIEQSDTNDNDLLDDMLEDLVEGDDIEQARINAELDLEVEVPLEKPGMDEVVVTADGRTLADMLPGLRAGNRPINKVVSEIRNQKQVVEVQGKKFTDDRYTKHVEVIDKEVAEREKRIALSMKFLQRNAEFTEQEKVIMRNLGLTSEQLAKVMKSKELTNKEKNEVLALGRYGAERYFKGRRYRTTVGDTAMLEFLVKFKYANTRILRWISNEPQNRTWRKLNRLRNSGLVESRSIIGIPDLWGATPSGTAIAGYSLQPGLRPMPKIPTISSGMGVNYIAACLWFNTVNVLNLEDFPASNRVIALQDDGRDRVRGEMLVSELEIRSSLGKEINPSSTTMQTLGDERLYDVISNNVRVSFEQWEDGGRLGDSPEFLLGNEYMWVLFPTSQLTLSYHVPDLVVKRERGPNGEPRSIAVEMERYEKTNDRYDKIMLAYKLDEHLYERVIWITPNTRVARALEQAAEQVGFDRYSIVPIITETGVYDKQDIWMI